MQFEDSGILTVLVTSTYIIEQYCKRRLLRKKYFERIKFTGDLFLPLREYPVTQILAVFVANEVSKGKGEIMEPERLSPKLQALHSFFKPLGFNPLAVPVYGYSAYINAPANVLA